MDETPEYIEMCRKAVEIQEYWHNSSHTISEWARSYFVSPKDDSLIHYYDFESYPQHSTGYTWLPLEGQLQDMVIGKYNNSFSVICVFCDWFQHEDDSNETVTREQLWLAFVQWELYGKKWDGTHYTRPGRVVVGGMKNGN